VYKKKLISVSKNKVYLNDIKKLREIANNTLVKEPT